MNGSAVIVGNGNVPKLDSNTDTTVLNNNLETDTTTEEIPYILHRRHVYPHMERIAAMCTASNPTSRKQPMAPPERPRLTRDQKKAQMNILKSSLTTPVTPAQKSPRDRSPTTRTYDMATFRKLPAMDSYSAKDDTISPSQEEKQLLMHASIMKDSQHEKARDMTKSTRGVSFDDNVSEIPFHDEEDTNDEVKVTFRRLESPSPEPVVPKPGLLAPRAVSEDLTPTESDSESSSDREAKKKSQLVRKERERLKEAGQHASG